MTCYHYLKLDDIDHNLIVYCLEHGLDVGIVPLKGEGGR